LVSRDYPLYRLYSMASAKELFQKAGLAVEKMYTTHFLPPFARYWMPSPLWFWWERLVAKLPMLNQMGRTLVVRLVKKR